MELLENLAILIFEVNLDVAQRMKKILSPYDITPEQCLILALLNQRGGLSQNEIALELNKDKSSVTRMITSLENKNLVRRRVDLSDRRYYEVSLTEIGSELNKNINPVIYRFLEQVYSGLSTQEIKELQRLLIKVRKNVTL